mmetsp:Transcript_12028/g.38075  ORF Transcript_12028/g.38075 Transcript_12028/m.38075 type:complete len:159 (-) Transcript_12028:71-547(-)
MGSGAGAARITAAGGWWRGRAAAALLLALLLAALGGSDAGRNSGGESSKGGIARYSFSIEPREGPSNGGTQVTLTVNSGDIPKGHSVFFCQFGDKVVPSQSFFSKPGDGPTTPAILCQTPAGPMRSSVTVKLSLEGTKFSAGPRYYYHEPTIPVWQRT